MEMYYEIQKKPYQFLLIDYKKNCFRQGFTEILLNFNDDLHKNISHNEQDGKEK